MLFIPQITVSSGGMLTQKLNVDDLQFEKGTFDGTMAYAQNKVKFSDLQHLSKASSWHFYTFVSLSCVLCKIWNVPPILVFLWDRDNRWSSQRGGPLSTKRSTFPPCTLAGPILQVKKICWNRFNLCAAQDGPI